jgi:Putative restriction endonuclease
MRTLEEIQHAIVRLPGSERDAISTWLQQLADTEFRSPGVAEPAAEYRKIETEFMTLDEYTAFEEQSPVRHEYLNGVLYAMSDASLAHYRITEALVTRISRTPARRSVRGLFSPGATTHEHRHGHHCLLPRRHGGLRAGGLGQELHSQSQARR